MLTTFEMQKMEIKIPIKKLYKFVFELEKKSKEISFF